MPNLTPAARRDLAAIRQGQRPALRYGPYKQLTAAGLITGPQDAYTVTEAGIGRLCPHGGGMITCGHAAIRQS